MRLTKDKLGCVFDVPTDSVNVIEEQWKGDKFATLEKLSKLPELLEGVSDANTSGGGSFNRNNQSNNNWNRNKNNGGSFNNRSNGKFQNNFNDRKRPSSFKNNNNNKFQSKKQMFGR